MSLPEIRAEVGCPTASLATTLRTLVNLGYLHHDRARRTYTPTVLLADLGGWVASRHAPGPAVQEAARTIGERTGENVAIAHRNDIRLQYLHFLPANDLSPSVRVGTTRLLCRYGLGWALLASLGNRAILSIVRRTNASLASEDRVDLEPLLAMVERCRRDGFIHAEHTLRAGYGVIAMPIRSSQTALAIGVSGPAERIRKQHDDIVAAMRHALSRLPP